MLQPFEQPMSPDPSMNGHPIWATCSLLPGALPSTVRWSTRPTWPTTWPEPVLTICWGRGPRRPLRSPTRLSGCRAG